MVVCWAAEERHWTVPSRIELVDVGDHIVAPAGDGAGGDVDDECGAVAWRRSAPVVGVPDVAAAAGVAAGVEVVPWTRYEGVCAELAVGGVVIVATVEVIPVGPAVQHIVAPAAEK